MRIFKRLAALICIVGMAVGAYGVFVEPGRLVVRSLAVESGAWPASHRPLRIAFLVDLHVGAPHISLEKLRTIVRCTNALRPDLVLLGGDYVIDGVVGGNFVAPGPIAKALAGLSATNGIVAVLGNHDWWNDRNIIRRAFEGVGIKVLENQALAIRHEGQTVWIAGIADDTTRTPDPVGVLSKINGSEPIIVVTHDPAIFPDVPKRAAMIFAGHSHGGQVYLPVVGALITPGRAPRRHAYGLIREDGRVMYVSGGIGTSIIPIRINMPPEIAIVTVRGISSKQNQRRQAPAGNRSCQ
jgi:predicted MPP superfamily phosphohydrolase